MEVIVFLITMFVLMAFLFICVGVVIGFELGGFMHDRSNKGKLNYDPGDLLLSTNNTNMHSSSMGDDLK